MNWPPTFSAAALSQSPYHQHEANSNLLLADAEVAASPPAPQAGGDVICVTLHSLLYNRKHTQKGVSLQSVSSTPRYC